MNRSLNWSSVVMDSEPVVAALLPAILDRAFKTEL
jgi:hypothetical protein